MENIYMINLKAIFNDGTANKTASYEVVGDVEEAKGTFHSTVGSYLKNKKVAHLFCECVDIWGISYGIIAEDVYPASTVETEVETASETEEVTE